MPSPTLFAQIDKGQPLSYNAARLKMRYPISYADAFAAALAHELRATLITGDPELESLQGEIPLEKLERASR